jgi:hypothetical protein
MTPLAAALMSGTVGFYIELYDAALAAARMPKSARRFRDACDSDHPPHCICCLRSFAVQVPKLWAVLRPVGSIQSPFTGCYGVCRDCSDDERAIVYAVAEAEGMDRIEFAEGAA